MTPVDAALQAIARKRNGKSTREKILTGPTRVHAERDITTFR